MAKVAIFGGGVGGLTAAHELVDRGFEVEIFEQKQHLWGGKARSIDLANSGVDGRKDLPGEHGFRFFPGFYRHIPDTMSRIPYPGNANGCLDNLVPTTQAALYRESGAPLVMPVNFPTSLDEWREAFACMFNANELVGTENALFFSARLFQLAASCQERWDAEFDQIPWWDFMEAETRGENYQKFLAQGLTRSLVAMQAKVSSTRTVGTMLLQLMFNMMTPGVQTDRVLNGPTNERWIDPWVSDLTARGVKFHLRSQVQRFNMADGRIRSVSLLQDGVSRDVTADYFVSAIPVEKMAALLTPDMLAAAPELEKLNRLETEWMNGIQFYLDQPLPIVHGHTIYADSPWALTSISQQQFWTDFDFNQYGDGRVRGILSVDISDWFTPGDQIHKKPAEDCLPEEIRDEVWAQLKAHLDEETKNHIDKVNILAFNLDPDITYPRTLHRVAENKEPLLINKVGSLALRPNADTAIPNLMLASDYVDTYTNLACMEGANEAGRRATNAILDRAGSEAERCQVWPYDWPFLFDALRVADRAVWELQHLGDKQAHAAAAAGPTSGQ